MTPTSDLIENLDPLESLSVEERAAPLAAITASADPAALELGNDEAPRSVLSDSTNESEAPSSSPLCRRDGEGTRLGIRSRRASAVLGACVEWLMPGRLAFGHVHVLDGDPGIGKSTLALDIAARLSRGLPMPEPPPPLPEEPPKSRRRGKSPPEEAILAEPPPPPPPPPLIAGSIIISAEDKDDTAVQPRLVAAGADLDRIEIVDEIVVANPRGGMMSRPLLFPDDGAELEALIHSTGARFVIIDPIMAFIGSDRRGRQIDAHKDQSVRQLMYALRRLAERTGACILLIRHLSKSMVVSALRRGLASIGIAAAARIVLLAADHLETPGVRCLAGVKTNLDAAATTLTYRIVKNAEGVARIEWLEECDYSADDLLRRRRIKDTTPTRQREAEAFLREILFDNPRTAVDVLAHAALRGLNGGTLDRAAKALGIERTKKGKQWMWEYRENGLPPLSDFHFGRW